MNCSLGPSFAGTPGAGEIIQKNFVFDFDIEKCSYLGSESIKSYSEFHQKVKRIYKREHIFEGLKRLQAHLKSEFPSQNIDPIFYIASLYYGKGISIQGVFDRINTISFLHRDSTSLCTLLVRVFGWELRDKNDITPMQMKKKKGNPKMKEVLQQNGKQKTQKALENYEQALTLVLENQEKYEKKEFSHEFFSQFHGKNSKLQKVFYLLECEGELNQDIILQLHSQYNVGPRILSHIINQKLKILSILYELKEILEVSQGNISYTLYNKKESSTQ